MHYVCIFCLPGYEGDEQSKAESEADKRMLKEALKEGVVKCKTMTVAITGHAGVGKTCTLRYILHKDPPDTRNSTGIIDGPFRAASVSHQATIEGHQLEEVSDGDILVKLFNAQQKSGKSDSQQVEAEIVTMEEAKQSTTQEESTKQAHLDDQSEAEGMNVQSTNALEGQNIDIDALIDELIQPMEGTPGDERKVELFFFLDSGGQPEYREMFHSLVPNVHMHIVVVNLSEGLDEYPHTQLFKAGELVGKHDSRYTNREIFKNSLLATHNDYQDSSSPDLTTLIIGTHMDHKNSKENLKEFNKELDKMVPQILTEEQLICYTRDDKLFPIDAMSRNHDKVVKVVRKTILQRMDQVGEISIPIRWFALRQLLCVYCRRKRTNLSVISNEECKEIAKNIKIEGEALKSALRFLRQHNLILYFPEIQADLPEILFCEPQSLLNPINDLVQGAYCTQSLHPDGKEVRFEGFSHKKFKDLEKMGIITGEFFQGLDNRFNDLFTLDEFFRIATHLGIAAEITDERYIFPCLLGDLDREEIEKIRDRSDPHPLLVNFGDSAPQNGTFTTLIANLIERHQWKPQEKTSHRNCMRIQLRDECCAITLIKSHTCKYFEVHTDEMESDSLCRIRQDVFNALPKTAPKAHAAFFCEECAGARHLATFSPDKGIFQCSKTKKINTVDSCSGYLKWTAPRESPKPATKPQVIPTNSNQPSQPTALEQQESHHTCMDH